jgi:hypothetical protein
MTDKPFLILAGFGHKYIEKGRNRNNHLSIETKNYKLSQKLIPLNLAGKAGRRKELIWPVNYFPAFRLPGKKIL